MDTAGLEGRGVELVQVDAAVAAVASGGAMAVMVTGEPGIGKTALLTELARRAEGHGFLVLGGRAGEFERDEPLALFANPLDAALREAVAEQVAAPGAESPHSPPGAQLGAVSSVLSVLAILTGARAAADRLQTHAAVRHLLAGLGTVRPVALLLDDLHWADTASIDLFGYLMRHLPRRVLLAAAWRPAQAPTRLLAATRGASPAGLLTLPLGPLGRADAGALLRRGVGDLDDAAVAELFEYSGGNPFFLTSLAHVATRPQPRRVGARRLGDPAVGGVPGPVLDALSSELRMLPEAARQAAAGAAVAGDRFEVDLAACAARLSEEVFVDALDGLVAADLVRSTDQPRRFQFRHPIVRHAVYQAAGPGWRLAAHGRVAAALAERGAGPLIRAHHVERSAVPGDQDAIAVLTEAGHLAGRHAPAAAAHWFAAALGLLPGVDRSGPAVQRRAELLAALARCAGAAGLFEQSRAAVDELLGLVPAGATAIRAELVAFRAFLDHLTGRPEAARALALRELAAVRADQHAERAALEIELANNALVRTDFDALAQHAAAALGNATRAGRAALRATAVGLVAYGEYNLARIATAATALDNATALVDAMIDEELASRLDAAMILSFVECNLERPLSAVAHATRALDLARGSGQVLVTPMLYVTRALGRAYAGQLPAAAEDAAAAFEVSSFTGNQWTASVARGVSSWVLIKTGEVEAAVCHAEDAIKIGAAAGSSLTTSNVGLYRAEALLEAGRTAEVQPALLEAAGGPHLPLLERPWRSRAVQVLVRAAVELGDLAAARGWLEVGTAAIADVHLPSRHADLRYAEAAMLLAEDRPAAAVPVALAAVDEAARGGVPVEAGRARILAGVALARSGKRADGVAQLQRAERDLDAVGARRYRDGAVRELRRLGRRVHRRPPGGQRGSLSARESEIAELVAAGRTNRQIAARLMISERTLETHVSRVLGKLRVTSRAAIGTALR